MHFDFLNAARPQTTCYTEKNVPSASPVKRVPLAGTIGTRQRERYSGSLKRWFVSCICGRLDLWGPANARNA